MKRIAVIKNGAVINIAVWDGVSVWSPSGDQTVDVTARPEIGIGWTYDGANFFPPAEEAE